MEDSTAAAGTGRPLPAAIALVTGASSGLGAAFARRLAAAAAGKERLRGLPGYDELVLVARRADRLEALRAELAASCPALAVRAVPLDLTAPGAIAGLADGLRAAGKPLSVLVNDAGYGTYGPFDEVDLDKQLGQVDLNCRALAEALGRLGPLLGRGSLVVNVASAAAFAPLGGFAVYAASKAFALSLSVGVGAEWKGRGVRTCAFCPGPVASEFALVASGGARAEVRHGFDADEAARRCLADAARGVKVSTPRLGWTIKRLAGWLFGPALSAAFAWRFMRRPHAGAAAREGAPR